MSVTRADAAAEAPVVSFGTRLAAAFAGPGPLCVGIDPHPFLLDDWGLPADAAGLERFGLAVVEAAAGLAGIVKPQVAFFERFGSAGYAALETVLRAAREAGLLVIADAKRGDVGTSVEAYGAAWLTPGSPLEADALTVSAYQGLGSLAAPLELADRTGKGLFVLAATSNPEAAATQRAIVSTGPAAGVTVAAGILGDVIEWNRAHVRPARTGGADIASVGVVIGATIDMGSYGIRPEDLARDPAVPILAPGFGHQGALLADVGTRYGVAASATIVSVSRSILSAGPGGIRAAIDRQSEESRRWIA